MPFVLSGHTESTIPVSIIRPTSSPRLLHSDKLFGLAGAFLTPFTEALQKYTWTSTAMNLFEGEARKETNEPRKKTL